MSFNNLCFDPFLKWRIGNNTKFQGFEFESIYNQDMSRFFQQYWIHSYFIGLIYIVVIFRLQRCMKNKSPCDLKFLLFLWNLSLAVFSVTAFLRTVSPFISILAKENGFYRSFCVKESFNSQLAFWGMMWAFSKFIELGDTLFIVLRKRPLVFIHWYHHLMILVVSWTNIQFLEPINMWFVVFNTAVHSALYLYFAAKTVSLPIPNFLTKMLTTVQFLQILISFSVNVISIYVKGVMGYYCARETISIIGSCIMGISFVGLFGKLLYISLKKVDGHQKRA